MAESNPLPVRVLQPSESMTAHMLAAVRNATHSAPPELDRGLQSSDDENRPPSVMGRQSVRGVRRITQLTRSSLLAYANPMDSTRSSLFMTTLTSTRRSTMGGLSTTSASPRPRSRGHGKTSRPRRFASRKVPHVAEELAHSETLSPDILRRFEGLMKYMKFNTDEEERQKQVIHADHSILIPEEYEDMVQAEFERRCAFGERENTELMGPAKWVRLLRDMGVIGGVDHNTKKHSYKLGTITLADAEIIFRQVLHNCDYGSKRLTYDLFCKALALVAHGCYPEDEEWEDAVDKLMVKFSAIHVPEPPKQWTKDYSLDPNVLMIVDRFKPLLGDLFKAFSSRGLGNPTTHGHGAGTVRLAERSFWKHSAVSEGGSLVSSMFGGSVRSRRNSGCEEKGMMSPMSPRGGQGSHTLSPPTSPTHHQSSSVPGAVPSAPTSPQGRGGYPSVPEGRSMNRDTSFGRMSTLTSPTAADLTRRSMFQPVIVEGSVRRTTVMQRPKDPYTYMNGAPTIKNRQSHMSADQFLQMCKELKIMPDLLHRQEITQIFKRAQNPEGKGGLGSRWGFLTKELFLDAFTLLAIEAFSKDPYMHEYEEYADKIHAFILHVVPGGSIKEHFLYGCGGRGGDKHLRPH